MNDVKEQIRTWFIEYVENYANEHDLNWLWKTPLVGFGDVNSKYIRELPKAGNPDHYMPEKFLEDATVVVSYFLPFKDELGKTNGPSEDNMASRPWAQAYGYTNTAIGVFNKTLAGYIEKLNYKAVIPYEISLRHDILMSNWSQRHIARAAGIGTFGINNMLITESGCAGRTSSIVSNIPVIPDSAIEEEYCLYKKNGSCMVCINNCFAEALTLDGFDRSKCLDMCNKNEDVYGEAVCGKCAANVPCSFGIPKA